MLRYPPWYAALRYKCRRAKHAVCIRRTSVTPSWSGEGSCYTVKAHLAHLSSYLISAYAAVLTAFAQFGSKKTSYSNSLDQHQYPRRTAMARSTGGTPQQTTTAPALTASLVSLTYLCEQFSSERRPSTHRRASRPAHLRYEAQPCKPDHRRPKAGRGRR
jgi:hypothetical protein